MFFAKIGYDIEGIDISETAIKRCIKRFKDANLKVKARVGDLRKLDISHKKYFLRIFERTVKTLYYLK